MAIYGTIEHCAKLTEAHPGFQTAFRFLHDVVAGRHEAARTVASLAPGENKRIDLDGDRVYALLQHPQTKRRADQQMEAHRRYADVQFALDPIEVLEVVPLAGLQVTRPYAAENDVELYGMPPKGSQLLLGDGLCAVLYPDDAHAPLQDREGTPRPSRRIVVKVRDPLSR